MLLFIIAQLFRIESEVQSLSHGVLHLIVRQYPGGIAAYVHDPDASRRAFLARLTVCSECEEFLASVEGPALKALLTKYLSEWCTHLDDDVSEQRKRKKNRRGR